MSRAPDDASLREGRSPLWAIGLLFLLFAATRLPGLRALPVFLDEAVHLQWAERLFDEGRLAKPVSAGRLLAVVVYGGALRFDDRLLAARAMACGAGALTLGALVWLTRRLFGARAGVVAGLLYVVSPFALVYDRLALSDVFLSAAVTAVALTAQALSARRTALLSVAFALCVALSVLAKVSAVLFLGVVPLAALCLASDRPRALLSLTLAAFAGILLASPMLWAFFQTGSEIAAQHIVDPMNGALPLSGTLGDMSGWLLAYFTPPLLLAALAAILVLRDGRALWLAASAILPFVLFAAFSEPWSARYVLPALPPVLCLVAGGLEHASRRFERSGAALTLLLVLTSPMMLGFDRALLVDPASAPFPEDDRRQLVTGWPSGYGVTAMVERLRAEAPASGVATVVVDVGGTRTVPEVLALELGRDRRFELVETDIDSPVAGRSLVGYALSGPTYAVVAPRPAAPDIRGRVAVAGGLAERLGLYERPGGEWAGSLFRVRAESAPPQ